MDFDSGKDWIFGNDADMDDIIWMGPQPTVKELAQNAELPILLRWQSLKE